MAKLSGQLQLHHALGNLLSTTDANWIYWHWRIRIDSELYNYHDFVAHPNQLVVVEHYDVSRLLQKDETSSLKKTSQIKSEDKKEWSSCRSFWLRHWMWRYKPIIINRVWDRKTKRKLQKKSEGTTSKWPWSCCWVTQWRVWELFRQQRTSIGTSKF